MDSYCTKCSLQFGNMTVYNMQLSIVHKENVKSRQEPTCDIFKEEIEEPEKESVKKPWAIVPPNDVSLAASSSRWINWRSPVTSAKSLTRAWSIFIHLDAPKFSPTKFCIWDIGMVFMQTPLVWLNEITDSAQTYFKDNSTYLWLPLIRYMLDDNDLPFQWFHARAKCGTQMGLENQIPVQYTRASSITTKITRKKYFLVPSLTQDKVRSWNCCPYRCFRGAPRLPVVAKCSIIA